MTLDLNRPLQTRDGRPARLVARDLKGDRPLAVVITNHTGNPTQAYEWPHYVTMTGLYTPGCTQGLDIINVSEPSFGDSDEGKKAILFLKHFVPADACEGLSDLAHFYLTSDKPKEPLATFARKIYYACKQAALKES